MATVAIRGRWIGRRVAKIARHRGMRSGKRKARCGVIERCAKPVGGRVARGACCRVSGCDVIRDRAAECRSALPVGCVAVIASRRKRARVVAINVARCARDDRVRPGQRERRGAVIEG